MRRQFCAAFSLLLALSSNGFSPAAAQLSRDPEARVAAFEGALFGNVSSGEPLDKRLAVIEGNLFAEQKAGSVSERLDAIARVLDPGSATTLASPLGPASGLLSGQPLVAPERERRQGRVDVSVQSSPELDNLFQKGTQSYQEGRLGEAEQFFQQVLKEDHDNVNALYNLGALAEERGDLHGAHDYYRLAVNVNPEDRQLRAAVDEVGQELSRRQASEDRAQAERRFALEAERTRLELKARRDEQALREQQARQDQQALREQQARYELAARRQKRVRELPVLPVARLPAVSFTSGRRSSRLGGGSLLRSVAGLAHSGTRIGLTAAAIHCPKCRRTIMGSSWLGFFGLRPNLP